MSAWLLSCWLLPVLALACRILPPSTRPGWNWKVDLPLLALLSPLIAWFSADWFARFYLTGSPLSTSDFSEYCEAVASAMKGEAWSGNPQRSRLVAGFLAILAEFWGVMDSLVIGAVIGMAATVAGLYLWAQAVAGRTAALVAAFSLVVFAPLVLMTRAPSFYAEMLGAIALANGLSAQALVRRTPFWILSAALIACILPLIESRGIFWTIPTWGLCLLASLGARGSWLVRGACVLGILGALGTGWRAGRVVFPQEFAGTLDEQVRTFVVDSYRFVHPQEPDIWTDSLPTCPREAHLNWGWSNPLDIPKTFVCLRTLTAAVNPEAATHPQNTQRWEAQVAPWLPFLAGALGVAVLGTLRTPVRLLAFLGPALPSFATLMTAINEPETRRLAPAFLVAPLILGVAWTVLSERTANPGHPLGRPLRLVLVLLLGCGILPSYVGPQAGWRTKIGAQDDWKNLFMGGGPPGAWDEGCREGLGADQARGLPPAGHLVRRWSR